MDSFLKELTLIEKEGIKNSYAMVCSPIRGDFVLKFATSGKGGVMKITQLLSCLNVYPYPCCRMGCLQLGQSKEQLLA